jgi:hypothetical protein
MTENISLNFTPDDIHNLRTQVAKQYRAMQKEDVERDIAYHVNNAKRTMESLRQAKNQKGN